MKAPDIGKRQRIKSKRNVRASIDKCHRHLCVGLLFSECCTFRILMVRTHSHFPIIFSKTGLYIPAPTWASGCSTRWASCRGIGRGSSWRRKHCLISRTKNKNRTYGSNCSVSPKRALRTAGELERSIWERERDDRERERKKENRNVCPLSPNNSPSFFISFSGVHSTQSDHSTYRNYYILLHRS